MEFAHFGLGRMKNPESQIPNPKVTPSSELGVLSIIGAGKVGKTLGALLHRAGVVTLGQVLNRSVQSAAAAVRFIGAGTAAVDFAELRPADLFMITTPDLSIEEGCKVLAASGAIRAGSV